MLCVCVREKWKEGRRTVEVLPNICLYVDHGGLGLRMGYGWVHWLDGSGLDPVVWVSFVVKRRHVAPLLLRETLLPFLLSCVLARVSVRNFEFYFLF